MSPGYLHLAAKARSAHLSNKSAILYRKIMREVPQVMQIYDIMYMSRTEIRTQIRSLFQENAHVKDERVVDMLVQKGYMELEETLLQHKQKVHLMLLLEGEVATHQNLKLLSRDATDEEQFARS